MGILYTTSSAQSVRELSLRRYSSVTVHRLAAYLHDCGLRDALMRDTYLQRRNSIPRTMPCVCSCDHRLCELAARSTGADRP